MKSFETDKLSLSHSKEEGQPIKMYTREGKEDNIVDDLNLSTR